MVDPVYLVVLGNTKLRKYIHIKAVRKLKTTQPSGDPIRPIRFFDHSKCP